MKPVIFLRIASILTLIHAILHTFGGVLRQLLSRQNQWVTRTHEEHVG